MTDHNDIFSELDIEVNEDHATGQFEEVELRTGVDPLFFAETMTSDVELMDAIFDLVDNSIDAARNIIISDEKFTKDQYSLPDNYSGYEIKIDFSDKKISIADNCLGIDSDTIENTAFYTGKKSNHHFGIGHYGLGLKRALLKAGKTFYLKSDNGKDLYISRFSHDVLSGDKEKKLIAKKYETQNRIGTYFSAEDLRKDIQNQISSSEWIEELINYLSIRYSIFIEKGLKIELRSHVFLSSDFIPISSSLPKFRSDGPLKSFSDTYTHDEELSVFFDVGVHHKYLFPGEYGSHANKKITKEITKEYGIYIICNDRVIVTHSFEKKYGFKTSPHSEYNGFLCYVRMISSNPANLPWNTTKTEIITHSPLFVEAKKPIEKLALKYRTKAKKVINTWLSKDIKHLPEDDRKKEFYKKLELSPPTEELCLDNSNETDKNTPTPTEKKPSQTKLFSDPKDEVKNNSEHAVRNNKNKHTTEWKTLLPLDYHIASKNQTLNNMIIEASKLIIKDASHASSMLYRSLLEGTLLFYVSNTGAYQEVKNHFYEKGEGKKKNHSDEYKKQQTIDLAMSLHWLLDQKDLFPLADRKELTECVKKARTHVGKLNGVVHCKNIISANEVETIRNETIKLLDFLTKEGNKAK
jgi:hypothetical protein